MKRDDPSIVKCDTPLGAIKVKKITIALCCIFLIALGLRTYQFPKYINWDADAGRDLLVASHYVTYNEWSLVSPYSAGTENLLKKSPLYYYVIAFIWYFTRKIEWFLLSFVIFQSITIFPAYYVGALLFNRQTGLIAALLYGGLAIFIQDAQTMHEASFVAPFVFWMLWVLIWSIKAKSIVFFLISLVIGFLGFHIHPSFFPVLIGGTVAGLYCLRVSVKKQMMIIAWSILSGGLWIVLIRVQSGNKLVEYSRLLQQYFVGTSFFLTVIHNATVLFSSLLSFRFSRGISAVFIVVSLLYFWNHIRDGVKKNLGKFVIILYVVIGVMFSFLSLFYVINDWSKYLLSSYYPLLILFLSWMLTKIERGMGIRFLAVFVTFVLIVFSIRNADVFAQPPPSKLQTSREIARSILYDSETRALSNFTILDCGQWDTYCSSWKAGHIWVLIETMTHRRHVMVTNTGYNFKPIMDTPEWVYVVCQRDMNGACDISGYEVPIQESETISVYANPRKQEYVLIRAKPIKTDGSYE